MSRKLKRFVALARVSSREQEREGFSLDIQEDALRQYADRNDGEIIRLFRIAETASKKDERKTFKELLAFAKANAHRLDGLLFYKVDRASRNLFDYGELERLESEHGLRFISVSQPTDNTPAGRMQRRMLASMASFYTEQQSLAVREGLARRMKSGLFVSKPPFGYINKRIDGRSLIEVDPENAAKVRRIYDLYAYHGHTIDSLAKAQANEGVTYCESMPEFYSSRLYAILTDRSYIGEIKHNGQWHPGTHESLVDRSTWERVQTLLGQSVYRSHQMRYAGELIHCAHCSSPITGEAKTKKTKKGDKQYVYYRCTRYNDGDHPRIRMTEAEIDEQLLALFDQMRVEDEDFRNTFREELRKATNGDLGAETKTDAELKKRHSEVMRQQDQLLNLRLLEEIDADTFASKATALRDEAASLRLQIEATERSHNETIDLAVRAFELSQNLRTK